MIDTAREAVCVVLGLAIGLLVGFFIYPMIYHRYLEKEGHLKKKDAKCVEGEQDG